MIRVSFMRMDCPLMTTPATSRLTCSTFTATIRRCAFIGQDSGPITPVRKYIKTQQGFQVVRIGQGQQVQGQVRQESPEQVLADGGSTMAVG
jgi:hypothetical protein